MRSGGCSPSLPGSSAWEGPARVRRLRERLLTGSGPAGTSPTLPGRSSTGAICRCCRVLADRGGLDGVDSAASPSSCGAWRFWAPRTASYRPCTVAANDWTLPVRISVGVGLRTPFRRPVRRVPREPVAACASFPTSCAACSSISRLAVCSEKILLDSVFCWKGVVPSF